VITKSEKIRAEMAAGNWRKAIALAARLPRLDIHRNAILDAHGAYVRPEWAKQLGKDGDALKAAGVAALLERFPYAKKS
jgi:hypothetical protein